MSVAWVPKEDPTGGRGCCSVPTARTSQAVRNPGGSWSPQDGSSSLPKQDHPSAPPLPCYDSAPDFSSTPGVSTNVIILVLLVSLGRIN